MKRRTKAKRKVNLGRRIVTAKRRKDGHVVERPKADRDPRVVVISARQRIHGELPGIASQEGGTAVGRAYLNSQFGDLRTKAGREQGMRMVQAARAYDEIQRAYEQSLLARTLPSGGDLDRGGGYDGREGDEPAYVEFCEKAERRMRESRRALLEADPFAQMAVNAWVLEDRELWSFLGELRVGLNALARLYAIPDADEDAA